MASFNAQLGWQCQSGTFVPCEVNPDVFVLSNVWDWRNSDFCRSPLYVRFRGGSGLDMLKLSSSGCDRKQTYESTGFLRRSGSLGVASFRLEAARSSALLAAIAQPVAVLERERG